MAFSSMPVLSAFGHRNYRLYWFGVLFSVIGYQLQFIGVGWLIYRLTGSPFYLGLVGLFTAVPTITLSLVGGVFADRMSRLHLLIITQCTAASSSLLLGILTMSGNIQVWHILALASVNGAAQAFDTPARQALLPDLVERDDFVNAVAMVSAAWQLSRVIGPALAGVLIASAGEAVCFFLTSFGYVILLVMLVQLRITGRAPLSQHGMWQNLITGLTFVLKTPLFAVIIGLTFMNSLFGVSYVTLMPAFAKDILHVAASGYGMLLTAGGAGAIIGSIVLASIGKRMRRGIVIMGGSAAFGLLLIVFSFTQHFHLAMILVGTAGMANSLYMVLAQTILQAEVPDELRGRVMGLYGMTWSLIPLGGMLLGTIAAFAGPSVTVAIGGFLVAGFSLCVSALFPRIRRLI